MSEIKELLREAVAGFEARGDQRSVEGRVERRRRRRQVTSGAVGLGVFVAAALLAWTAFRPGESVTGSTGPGSATPSPTILVPDVIGLEPAGARAMLADLGLEVSVALVPSDETERGLVAVQDPPAGSAGTTGSTVMIGVSRGPAPAEPVPIGQLPEAGVAVESGGTVELVALDGRVVTTLSGYALAGNPGAPGIWLQRGSDYFSLDVDEGALVPVSDDLARDVIDDEGTEPELSPPADAPAGRWRYAVESTTGVALAQWSGECEGPTAFWIGPEQAPSIVTGGSDVSAAPQSLALGWTGEGQAVVLVSTAPCGGRATTPGVFLYSAPGAGRLLHPVDEGSVVTADSWGTGL